MMPEGWIETTLGHCLRENPSYGANASAVPFSHKLPRYVRITDIRDCGTLNQDSVSIAIDNVIDYLLEDGDFLIARSGNTVGKSFRYNRSLGPCAYAGYLLLFRFDETQTTSAYFKHVAQSDFYWQWVKSTLRTGAQPNINSKEYSSFIFPLPPLPEQRAIAEILDSVDATISATEATLAQTRRVKQALLQQLLTKGIDENGRPHTKFKMTEIGEIPEAWEVSSFGSISDEVTVGIACSATHAYVPKGEGVAMIRNQNIKDGWIDESDMLNVRKDFDSEFSTKRLREGDLVIARTGYPGLTAVVPKSLAACQTFTTLIVRIPKTISSDYCAIWMNSPLGAAFVSRLQAGGAQQNLNAGALKTMPILLPPYKEQLRIVAAIFDVREDMHRKEKSIRELGSFKRALMRDLLTGKVRVKDVKL